MTTLFTRSDESRDCKSCKGTGISVYSPKACDTCGGRGHIEPPDAKAIVELIKGRKGLCSKAPDHYGVNFTLSNLRAYYVWRLARFHGGVDVTLPMNAMSCIHGDPFENELNKIADTVARRVFGTDKAAATRWSGVMGKRHTAPKGLPASAYSGGPVVLDGNKPEEELLELW